MTDQAVDGEEAQSLAWARALVRDAAWVLHQPTCTVARASKLHAERSGTYTSTVNQEPVNDPVLEMDDGNAFVARAGNFLQLSEADVKFFLEAQEGVRELVRVLAMVGAGSKIPKSMTGLLIRSALQAQVQKLSA
jgi:hypothetical protein